MFNKMRGAMKFYSTLIEWVLRRHRKWGLSIASIPREPFEMRFSVDVEEDPTAPYRATIQITADDAIAIWKLTYLARTRKITSMNFDVGSGLNDLVRSAEWFYQGDSKADIITTIVICPSIISLEGLDEERGLLFTYAPKLREIFDHFNLPDPNTL